MLTGQTVDGLLTEAARRGRHTAVVDGSRRISLARFDAEVTHLARVLGRRGVGRGTRVALALPSGLDTLELFFAVLRAGGVAVPVSPQLPGPVLTRTLAAASARILITPNPMTAVQSPPGLLDVITVPAGTPPGWALAAAAPAAPAVSEPPMSTGRPAAIFLTTGTTGDPRPVLHTHRSIVASVRSLQAAQRSYFRGAAAEVSARLLRMAWLYRGRAAVAMRRQRWLTPMPFHTIAGFRFMLQAIVTRQSLVLLPGFSPRGLIEAVRREKISVLALTPAMLEAVLPAGARTPADFASLLVVGLGSAPARPDLIRRAERILGCPVLNGYGSTETAGGILVTRIGDGASSGVGYPLPGIEIMVADEAGRPVPPGTLGELLCRTGSLMDGYCGQDRPDDGWYHTGDLAVADERGAIHLAGRTCDVINRGGTKIVPATVEQVLLAHPAITAAAVVGVPDPVAGECSAAFVVASSAGPLRRADVTAHCRRSLPPAEIPDRVYIVPALPQALSGEVRRADLRAEAIRRQAAGRQAAANLSSSSLDGHHAEL